VEGISTYQKKKKKGGEEDAFDKDAWMVTFGDLLQLLITFFVLLISMSSMDKKIFKEMFTVFSGGLGVLGFTDKTLILPPTLKVTVSPPRFDMQTLKTFLRVESLDMQTKAPIAKDFKVVVNSLLISGVEIERRGRDYVMTISEEANFAPGKTEIPDSLKPILDNIGAVLSLSKNRIIIEGHTDDRPFSSATFATNWELSAGRAASVLIYLANEGGVDPDRMEAKGYGPYRPKVGNISEAYRKRNRRIEIVIKQFAKDSF